MSAAHADAKTNGIYNICTIVQKPFHGNIFEGQVTSYVAEENYYKILYEDGDVEEYDDEDMENYFYGKKKKKQQKTNNKKKTSYGGAAIQGI